MIIYSFASRAVSSLVMHILSPIMAGRNEWLLFPKCSPQGLDVDKFQQAFADLDLAGKLALHGSFCKKALHLQPGDSAVIINGRVYGPFLENETFASEDFRLAEQLSIKSAGMEAMAKQLAKMLPSRKPNYISELVWRAASVLESAKWRLSSFAKSVSYHPCVIVFLF